MKHLTLSLFIFAMLFSCRREKNTEKINQNNFYDAAFTYREQGKTDSAFSYFNKAKDLFIQQKNRFGAGKCLVNMALISTDKGDNFGGQEISLNAISYLKNTEESHLVYITSNLNNLGITAFNLKEYSLAIGFYKQTLKYTKDTSDILVIKNNIANAYRQKKDYKKSLQLFRNILSNKIENKKILARTLSNFAYTKWLENPTYRAQVELLKALSIRREVNDKLGQNASYSHLADYYSDSKPDSALFYADKMYNVAQTINSPDDKIEALQKLIKLSEPNSTKKYFKFYLRLNDSLYAARNAAKNQFALIRYESEKNKADNLKLQKENTEKKFEVATREFLLLVGFIIFLSAAFITTLWYRKRKEHMKAESQKAITESRLKTSKKVHDVVANGLYRVMTEIENEKKVNKELILDKIETLYEKSRDISYEKPVSPDKPFNEVISELLSSFATEKTKILIAGNDAELWLKINEQSRYELEHIIQELMVNMQKHSHASNVALRFENINEQINIYYTDNGLGMPEDAIFGNGLRNTGNRIEQIKGAITFDTKVQKGLKIQISFPVS